MTIPHATIPGCAKPISRLVIGAQQDRTRADPLWDRFLELGGNAFDTSWWYGEGATDRCLGSYLAERGARERAVILAKGAHTPGCWPEELDRQIHASLEFLRTDHVELYLMHRDNPEVPVGEFVDVLAAHHAAGRIGVYGGSNWTVERIEAANAYAASAGVPGFGAVSNNYSLATMEQPVWDGCLAASAPEQRAFFERTGTPLFPWSSQARGFFVRGDPAFTEDKLLADSWYSEANFERKRRAEELGTQLGVTGNNVALAYVLHRPFPTFPLVGPATVEELETTLPALGLELTPAQLDWLELATDRQPA